MDNMERKRYIQQMFSEKLTEEEQCIISCTAVICKEGLPMNVLCNLLMPEKPYVFYSIIDTLCNLNWLTCDFRTITCEQDVAEAVLEVSPIDANTVNRIIIELNKYIILKPLDDMLSRRDYFVAARFLLTYILTRVRKDLFFTSYIISLKGELFLNTEMTYQFAKAIIAFAANAELSFYGNKRQPVRTLEERSDYILLNFLKTLYTPLRGRAYHYLGMLYNSIFRYEEAKECFQEADMLLGKDENLLLAQAKMYENLGIWGKAFQFAYKAYSIGVHRYDKDTIIEKCLYLAYLSGIVESKINCKQWLNKARSIIGDRMIPQGHIYGIYLQEIEVFCHYDDPTLANQILDGAEHEAILLYGDLCPELGKISFIRSFVSENAGQSRTSNKYYRHYVHLNHHNYGHNSIGDVAVLYSAIVSEHLSRGNTETAKVLTKKMQDLHAEDKSIAPGVRLGQAYANYHTYLSTGDYNLCGAYIEVAKRIYEDELCPDEKTIQDIMSAFHNNMIPESVLIKDHERIIELLDINLLLVQGMCEEAKSRILTRIDQDGNNIERLKWQLQLGRCFLVEGKIEECVDLWRKIIKESPKGKQFELCKDMGEWAHHHNFDYIAKEFYEIAIQYDIMAYGKTCDIAEVLKSYANVLDECGIQGSDEPWEQASLLMESMKDYDGLALLYWSWSSTKQDSEAENLVKKAIANWRPDDSYDETLSNMYYNLCLVQGMQGKTDDAKKAGEEAIRLYPTDYPDYLLEDINSYL